VDREEAIERIDMQGIFDLLNVLMIHGINDFSHSICLIGRRQPDSFRTLDIIAKPITPTASRRLSLAIEKLERTAMLNWLTEFSRIPLSMGMVGPLFEAYLHVAFHDTQINLTASPTFRGTSWNSRWHAMWGYFSRRPRLKNALAEVQNPPQDIKLDLTPLKSDLIRISLSNRTSIEDEVYYIPEEANTMCIDGFIVHMGYLYLFQYTGGAEHGINDCLSDLLSQISPLPDRCNWRFIFVFPSTLSSFQCPNVNFLRGLVPYVSRYAV
jgi:hypothetical protein